MSTIETPRLDRRQRKSRAALQGALATLIGQKPYAEITIDDVAATADVARATFYAHYTDKADLLASATQRLIDELAADVAPASWTGAGTDWTYDGGGLLALLRHIERNRDLYKLVITGEGGPLPRREVIDTLRKTATGVFVVAEQSGRPPRQPLELTVATFVGALLAVLEDWIDGTLTLSAEDLAVTFMQHQVGGLEWAFGFEPGEIRFTMQRPSGDA